MSKRNKNNNNFPFSNEIKQMKDSFKRLIDDMPDEEFIDMISFLMYSMEEFEDEDWTFDEDWEDDAEDFYDFDDESQVSLDEDDDVLPF